MSLSFCVAAVEGMPVSGGVLELMASAIALAGCAGVNLYLTVLVTGIAIQMHWVVLSPAYQGLNVLSHPAVIGVAAVLYVLEFFADKIPWVDSVWDLVHTLIRPVGGAILVLGVIGKAPPVMLVIGVLLAGGISLATHSMKAGIRLVANASPEPFSNVILSLIEDAAVLGGLVLLHFHPVIALAVFIVLMAVIFAIAPRMFRAVRAILWLCWKKLSLPAFLRGTVKSADLPVKIPSGYSAVFSRHGIEHGSVKWCVECLSGHGARRQPVPVDRFGWLLAERDGSAKLMFLSGSWLRKTGCEIVLDGLIASVQSRFLSENLVLKTDAGKIRMVFQFDRSKAELVQRLAYEINQSVSIAAAMEQQGIPETGNAPSDS